MRFLSIGECMVEMAPNQDGTFTKGFAGDTFNTAWYAHQVAGDTVEVAYFTAVGTDDASRDMVDFMKRSGIDPVVSIRPDRTVGLYMISLNNGERSFSYWRGLSAARTLADDLEELPGLKAGDMAFFSGITLAVLPDEGRRKLLAALTKAQKAGVQIAFDSNLRPKLWANTQEMQSWIMQGAKVANIALPSFDDEAEFFGDADTLATAKRYKNAGAKLVCVKDGPNPVTVHVNGETISVDPVKAVKVVDSTSAGDSFNAQFLMGQMMGEPIETAVLKACELSAKVVGVKGALACFD